ncbi:MAG: hypothetical protein KJ904_09320 [Alphaproteobacteria bacterium]|nr:hypothetical protein [Alphaproteobacteria bacterium]MBU0795729.1 hypothetical protein [Alphaproteobacteria bacterium]MBU0887352.1 hypothetical protein [Alphaproteobacteria bacterium]MBU1811767.1 hypothetical protein [Alphaproteobacteria bacterium]MBU2089129.1 hypothetical protein [Alphaproteobacteria bacterium]
MNDESDSPSQTSEELIETLLSTQRNIAQMPMGIERFRAINTLIDDTRIALRVIDARIGKMAQEVNATRDELTFVKRHRGKLQTFRNVLAGTYRNPDRAAANFDGFVLNHDSTKLRQMMKDPDRLGIVRGSSFLGLIKNTDRREALDNYERQVLKMIDSLIGDHRPYLHALGMDWEGKLAEQTALAAHETEQKTILAALVKEMQEELRSVAKHLTPEDIGQLRKAEHRIVDWLNGTPKATAAEALPEN